MMKKIDATGQACPLPVIQAKRALETEKSLSIIVDNEIATQNLKKFASQKNVTYRCIKQAANRYEVFLSKESEVEVSDKLLDKKQETQTSDIVKTMVFDSLTMGSGSEELGKKLMSGFIASLLEQAVLPKYLVFYNEGVKLLVGELAHSFDELKAKGVTLFACGACTEQYQVTEKITSAEIVNMFFITELLLKSDTVINI